MVTSHDFQLSALPIMGRAQVSKSSDFGRAVALWFSMSPHLCVHVWDEIEDALLSGAVISHLLWALLLLKVYRIKDTMAAMVQTPWKTYRKWGRIVIEEIHSLPYVSLLHCLFV